LERRLDAALSNGGSTPFPVLFPTPDIGVKPPHSESHLSGTCQRASFAARENPSTTTLEAPVKRMLLFLAAAMAAGCGAGLLEPGETRGVGQSAVAQGAVWFSPNVGSTDLLELFTEPHRWPQARSRVSVVQFYAQQVGSDREADCSICGPNVLPALAGAGAFDRLREWGIDVAFETGSVKHHTCQGKVAGAHAAGLVDRVIASGGRVRYIAMDEPLLGGADVVNGESCGLSPSGSAREVAAFMAEVKTRHLEVEVGDIEPYPYYRVSQLSAWLDELDRAGVKLAFFHLDVDLNFVKNARADVSGDLRRLKSVLDSRGIPLGVIFTVHEREIPRGASTDTAARAYHDSVMKWARTVKASIGAPDHAIFQSWLESPGGARVVPRNLDEGVYSHTRVVNEGSDLLGIGPRVSEPSPEPSPEPDPGDNETPVRGDEAETKVSHLYVGVLGRPADPSGLSGHAAWLRGGGSMVELCRGFFASGEFASTRAHLTPEKLGRSLYKGILGREADPGGLAETTRMIRNGTRAERAAAMIESPEFRERFL
jgi:hypothetical protein